MNVDLGRFLIGHRDPTVPNSKIKTHTLYQVYLRISEIYKSPSQLLRKPRSYRSSRVQPRLCPTGLLQSLSVRPTPFSTLPAPTVDWPGRAWLSSPARRTSPGWRSSLSCIAP